MEIIIVKVRSSCGDKKLHVFRFLFPNHTYDSDCIYQKLREFFPGGFYPPKIERFMIDYSFDFLKNELIELCNHDYLATYLTSSKKIE